MFINCNLITSSLRITYRLDHWCSPIRRFSVSATQARLPVSALRRSRGLLLRELCNGGRYLRTFQSEISSPRTQVSFQFFVICIILNIHKRFMLKKLGNKNKNFRRSSTLNKLLYMCDHVHPSWSGLEFYPQFNFPSTRFFMRFILLTRHLFRVGC